MKAIRGIMTAFMVVVLWVTFMGWRWSAGLPSPKLEGARVALAITAIAAVSGIVLIWKYDPHKAG